MTLMLLAALVMTQSAPPLPEPTRAPLTPPAGVISEQDPAWTAVEQKLDQPAVKRAPRMHARSLCLACFPTGGAALAAGFVMSVVSFVSLVSKAPRFEDRAWAPVAGVLGAIPFVGPILGLAQPTNNAKTTTLFALSLVSEVTGTVLMVLGALREKPAVAPAVVPLPGGAAATLGGVW